jgi:hypothetical protein
MKTNYWNLFLDDIRNPVDGDWIVARSVAEAMELINSNGLPVAMSLDHDLGDHVPTGKDFLNDLVEIAQDSKTTSELSRVQMTVHSANPVGRANMESLWAQTIREFAK